MALILSKEDILQEGSSTVILSLAEPYINYTPSSPGGVVSSSATPPSRNDLFSYSVGVEKFQGNTITFDVYDFNNSTITLDGFSIGIGGLFGRNINMIRNMYIKNLTIKVEAAYVTVTGFLFIDYIFGTPSNIVFVDNCHIFFEVDSVFDASGLIGDYFKNGIITKCSFDYVEGSARPNIKKGGIIGHNGASANTASVDARVEIYNCFSTGTIDGIESGGICGGRFVTPFSETVPLSGIGIISNCYSTGEIKGNRAGGITGAYSGYTFSYFIRIITLTIENCYSTGDITGIEAGGIIGYQCFIIDQANPIIFSSYNIFSCYSTGAIIGAKAGGIGGSSTGVDDPESPATVIVINLQDCYILNGGIPVLDFGTGNLVGADSDLNRITSTNNSFGTLMEGVGTVGRVDFPELLENSTSYSSEYRCVFEEGEALMLLEFLSDNWIPSDDCLDVFAPLLKINNTCPLEYSDGKLWPQTDPDSEVAFPCEDGVILTRICDFNGMWEEVVGIDCGDTLSVEMIANITIFTVIIVLAVIIAIMAVL